MKNKIYKKIIIGLITILTSAVAGDYLNVSKPIVDSCANCLKGLAVEVVFPAGFENLEIEANDGTAEFKGEIVIDENGNYYVEVN